MGCYLPVFFEGNVENSAVQEITSARVIMHIPRIKHVEHSKGYILFVTFTDGTKKRYSVEHLLQEFTLLQNLAFFKNYSIEPGGYAISWNDQIDISEYEILKNGEDVEG
ncbi:hypothetical protein CCP3SC1AL1_970010 [Gammaproteobacteria bacterium]